MNKLCLQLVLLSFATHIASFFAVFVFAFVSFMLICHINIKLYVCVCVSVCMTVNYYLAGSVLRAITSREKDEPQESTASVLEKCECGMVKKKEEKLRLSEVNIKHLFTSKTEFHLCCAHHHNARSDRPFRAVNSTHFEYTYKAHAHKSSNRIKLPNKRLQ